MDRSGGRILVVDDDAQILKLFQRILEAGGHSVTTASAGDVALQIIRSDAFDLVVLDLGMPDPDGFEILKFLRANVPDTKVLVISGYMQGPLLKAAELVGASVSLSKTDAPHMLSQTVSGLLHR